MPASQRIRLRVGDKQDPEIDTGLENWLEQLKNSIENQQQDAAAVPLLDNTHIQTPHLSKETSVSADKETAGSFNYQTVGRILLMRIRDQGQQRLGASMQRCLSTVKPGHSLGTWEPALGISEFDHVKRVFDANKLPIQQYYQLQQKLSEHMQKSDLLQQQWLALPPHASEVPQTRTMLQNLFQTVKQSHTEWLSLLRNSTEKVWKLRMDLVRAYEMLVNDTVREFDREAQKIVGIYQEVRKEIDHQIKLAEDNEFYNGWTRTYENFRYWLQSIAAILPPSITFQQEVDTFLLLCDMAEDPCCLKRVHHLRDQLDRIQSVLQIHRQSEHYLNLESSALHQQLKMTTTEWTQTQAQLDQVQRELQNLSMQRVTLWSKGNSVKNLEELEQRQQELEKKQSFLTEKISPLRMAMERVRQQNTDVLQNAQLNEALQQAEEWKHKLQRQQEQCEKESREWSKGRGVQYRARETSVEETVRALDSLYVTSQQKIDGAGLALMRYGLLVLQNLISSIALPSLSEQQKQRITQDSLYHHIQRLALNHPTLAELLHQQSQSDTQVRKLRNELEEMQLQNMVSGMIQEVLHTSTSSF